MLIYSIMPIQTVFPSSVPKRTLQKVKGGFLETDADKHIQRIISTDLKMYTKHQIGDEANSEKFPEFK